MILQAAEILQAGFPARPGRPGPGHFGL